MSATAELGETDLLVALGEARERTLALVGQLSEPELERVHSTLMSPLVWDLGHIAAFEDLWISHRVGGRALLREDLAEIYDAFETPRAGRGDLAFLHTAAALQYLADVRGRTLEVLADRGAGDGVILELIVRHEHQHNETMLQTMQLAGLAPFTPPPPPTADGRALTGLELIDVPGGPCEIGAPADGFAYDNERPRHRVTLPPFRIARVPVTNGAWREWIAHGGYDRRDWWSPEGWAWRTREDVRRPLCWTEDLQAEQRLGATVALDPACPVIHVSHHEAQAFARAHGARLPTELEWERAASHDPENERSFAQPWGDAEPILGHTANLDQLAGGTVPAGALPAGASPVGCEQLLGDVWEWCASEFDGYPGFRAFPYPEYSEVFFAAGYRVLRGGSWATRARVATVAFRNWDLPQRRQIFSGLRLAADA